MGSQKLVLGYSLALACIVGFCVTALNGRETPVHAIAWAVSLSFLVCLLAPKLLDTGEPSVHRKFWLLGVFMGAMGIVLSQSRGVYGILIWLVLAGYVAAVKPGRVLFEVDGVSEVIAREALRKAGTKLPLKTKSVAR
jgi:asparagine N-glycosylation enzyme membrane subunit Stt3